MVWRNAAKKTKSPAAPLLLILAALAVLCAALLCGAPKPSQAAGVDYEELQEDPLDTAFRKLQSTGGIEWDELAVKRLKKRKLWLKDCIARL